MKVKGNVFVDVWYDEKIRLYAASYKDSKGKIIGEPEYGPSKTSALLALQKNGPELEFEKTSKFNGSYADDYDYDY